MRRTLIGIAVGLLAAAAVPAGANASRYCGFVVFEPNSDYVAGQIRATHLGCPRAIAVAVRWTVEGSASRPYGFRCRYHVVYKGLTHADVRCVRGRSVVTFVST